MDSVGKDAAIAFTKAFWIYFAAILGTLAICLVPTRIADFQKAISVLEQIQDKEVSARDVNDSIAKTILSADGAWQKYSAVDERSALNRTIIRIGDMLVSPRSETGIAARELSLREIEEAFYASNSISRIELERATICVIGDISPSTLSDMRYSISQAIETGYHRTYIRISALRCREGKCEFNWNLDARNISSSTEISYRTRIGQSSVLCDERQIHTPRQILAGKLGLSWDDLNHMRRLPSTFLILTPPEALRNLREETSATSVQLFSGFNIGGLNAFLIAPWIIMLLSLYVLAHAINLDRSNITLSEMPPALPLMSNWAAGISRGALLTSALGTPLLAIGRSVSGLDTELLDIALRQGTALILNAACISLVFWLMRRVLRRPSDLGALQNGAPSTASARARALFSVRAGRRSR